MPSPDTVSTTHWPARVNPVANEPVPPAAEQVPVDDQSLDFLNAGPDAFDTLPAAPQKTAADSAPAAQPASAQATPKAAPAHPAALVREARDVGVDDRIISKLDTDELMDHVLGLQRKFHALEAAESRIRDRRPEPTQPAAPVVDEDEAEIASLEADGIDSRLIKLVRKQKAKINEIEGGQKQRNEQESQRRTNEAFQAVDDSFADLGAKFEKIVGKGELTAQPESIQARRKSIFRAAGIDIQADAPRVIAKKIQKAAMELFGDVVAEPKAEVKPDAKPSPTASGYTAEQWDRGTVERPTASRPAKERGARAAAAAVHQRMQEMGVHAGPNGTGDDFDGLPD